MEGALVISNTRPLINFAEIGRMDILSGLFGKLVIPPAVRDELQAKSMPFPLAAVVPSLTSISIMSPADALLVSEFATRMHPGESECLALAMEHPGSMLLIDDLAAREIAAANGLPFTGTLGCLSMAKQKGLLPAIAPALDELRAKARFWISNPLAERILRDAGER